jgi:micrococcal nuclease
MSKGRTVWIGAGAILAGLLAGRGYDSSRPAPPPVLLRGRGPITITTTVKRVIDGDTMELVHGRELIPLRIFGIDAPEMRQPGGFAARDALGALMPPGKLVRVDLLDGRDKYGRAIGKVFDVKTGGDVGLALVEIGLAWWYRPTAEGARDLAEAEEHARGNRLGLWATENPQPPWIWRHATPSPSPNP